VRNARDVHLANIKALRIVYLTVLISPVVDRYMPQEGVDKGLMVYKAHQILLLDRFLPDKKFLEIHHQEYFIK
jgi:hypothetical protein